MTRPRIVFPRTKNNKNIRLPLYNILKRWHWKNTNFFFAIDGIIFLYTYSIRYFEQMIEMFEIDRRDVVVICK